MRSQEEIDREFPNPLKIEIGCDYLEYDFAMGHSLQTVREEYNRSLQDKSQMIPAIEIAFSKPANLPEHRDSDFDSDTFPYKIFVANNEIAYGIFRSTEEFEKLKSICLDIFKTWGDKIVEQAMKNEQKVKELERQGKLELVLGYYTFYRKKGSFKILKQLAMRYPNSIYMRELRRQYRYNGAKNSKHKSSEMSEKLKVQIRGYDRYF